METLTFRNGDDSLQLTVELERNRMLPSCDDALVAVNVNSASFSARNDVWVHAGAFVQFCRGLIALERSRKGVARLESLSPGELNLSLRSVSALGAMSVGGTCGYSVHRPHGAIIHRIEFGFEFDPSQLISAASTSWVREYAA